MEATLEQHPTKPTMWRVVESNDVLTVWHTAEKARRLAACVNACEGIDTDQLETIALAKHLVKSGKIKKAT